MPDIMVVLACLSQCVELTTLRQLGRVIEAMLSISGRVTMKGLSRWSGKGGSYRTSQRFFNTSLHWCQLNWLMIRHHLLEANDVILMSGDHVVVTKSGKTTYGLDRFFSSLYGKAVPGLCFLSLSLLSVTRRTSYPVVTEQVDKPCEAAVHAPPKKKAGGSRGRPKGSKNRHRREVDFSPSRAHLRVGGVLESYLKQGLEGAQEARKDKAVRASSPLQPLRVFRSAAVAPHSGPPWGVATRSSGHCALLCPIRPPFEGEVFLQGVENA